MNAFGRPHIPTPLVPVHSDDSTWMTTGDLPERGIDGRLRAIRGHRRLCVIYLRQRAQGPGYFGWPFNVVEMEQEVAWARQAD